MCICLSVLLQQDLHSAVTSLQKERLLLQDKAAMDAKVIGRLQEQASGMSAVCHLRCCCCPVWA